MQSLLGRNLTKILKPKHNSVANHQNFHGKPFQYNKRGKKIMRPSYQLQTNKINFRDEIIILKNSWTRKPFFFFFLSFKKNLFSASYYLTPMRSFPSSNSHLSSSSISNSLLSLQQQRKLTKSISERINLLLDILKNKKNILRYS